MIPKENSALLDRIEDAADENLEVNEWVATNPLLDALYEDRTVQVWWETRYSDDQPRDDHGRWTVEGGPSDPETVARESMAAASRTWLATVSPVSKEQLRAVEDYQAGSKAINSNLRDPSEHPDERVVRDTRLLEEAIDAQKPTTAETTLYRGIGPSAGDGYTQLEPGTRITEPGFVSASTSELQATVVGGPGAIVITAPAGSRGISPSDLTERYQSEREVVLPSGSQFEITGHDGNHTNMRLLL